MQINGGAKVTCESLGWSFRSLARRSMDADVVTLQRREKPQEAAAIADGAAVSFWVGETRIFEGVTQAPEVTLADGMAVLTQRVLGPWWQLSRVTFCRGAGITANNILALAPPEDSAFVYVVPAGAPWEQVWDTNLNAWVTREATTTYYKWGRQTLYEGRGNTVTNPIVLDLAGYLSARGDLCDPAIIGSSVQYRNLYVSLFEIQNAYLATQNGLNGVVPRLEFGGGIAEAGTVGTIAPKIRQVSDRKISDVLAELFAAAPQVCSYVDYEKTGLPAICFDEGGSVEVLSLSSPEVVSVDAVPRPELQVSGVVLRYENGTSYISPLARGVRPLLALDKYPATCVPHEPGALTHTLDFSLDAYRFGLAQKLYESFATLRATGSIEMMPPSLERLMAVRPGVVFAFDTPSLAGSQMIVQETVWTPFNNRLNCTIGLPKRLDLQTMADLRGWVQVTFGGWGWQQTVVVGS